MVKDLLVHYVSCLGSRLARFVERQHLSFPLMLPLRSQHKTAHAKTLVLASKPQPASS
jgi:hypothetical protein